MLAVACVVGIPLGCSGESGPSPEDVTSTSEALTVTISGTIRDTGGNALSGVTVHLNGNNQATATTGANGTYSFTVTTPNPASATGSWSVQPTRTGCTFNPSVVNFNNINGSRVANFTGSGTACVGFPATSKGVDPGPRGGPANAGGPVLTDPDSPPQQAQAAVACLPGLLPGSPALLMCEQAYIRFQEIDSVSGTIPGEDGVGLGPTFNANSCAMCHAQPGPLGSSPGLTSKQNSVPNPQVAVATLDGAKNTVPSFITANGPVREVRFVKNADGSNDGGVHDLFTISGRTDAQGCAPTQPPFAAQFAAGNIIFRIPTPTFGLGLVENTPDATLAANVAASASATLGIAGVLNTTGNDGTVTRFGWKAQNKSLVIFAGEAYNVEQGVSNEVFQNERGGGAGNLAGCFSINGTPEDHTDPGGTGSVSDTNSDVQNFAIAMRLSAPPVQTLTNIPGNPTAASIANGQTEFINIGCANCHTPSLTTNSKSSIDNALANVTYRPFSDFAIHHMGALADGINQGGAGPDQFRTAPLWGVGQRLFFLHDGRTSDLGAAIEAHGSAGSEASAVITNFDNLTQLQQQDILNFLRSL
jgi:CxxC motif-containing protein (DUF1111 family)